jgi:K+-sensing histidine kinase KdpD
MDALVAITRSSEHLKNLIDDVLNLARVESGKENPEPQVVLVSDLLEQSYKLMMQSAINKGINLEQPKLGGELKELGIFADPKHTQQIIINLMSNAVKYTPRNGKVWLTTQIVVDKVRINIHDSGVGIPPHKQATLFERFERGDDTYSKSQEGTGIGLNLTRHLVEINGGRIGVESVQGQGSTFWVMLPIADAQAQAASLGAEETDKQVQLSGLSTMVVDDNKDTCEVLRMILSNAGASVKVAHSVREGVQLLGEGVPDIILTDLAMPFNTFEALTERFRTCLS